MEVAIKLAGMSADIFRHGRIKVNIAVAMIVADGEISEACCKMATTPVRTSLTEIGGLTPKRSETRSLTTSTATPLERPATIARGMNGTAAASPVPARKIRKIPANDVDKESPRTPCLLTMLDATVTKRTFGALIRTFYSPRPEAKSPAMAAQEMP